jgi:predicted RND superfamily exporter protein
MNRSSPEPIGEPPVVRDPAHFDPHSGPVLERLFFNHRRLVLALCTLVTLLLAWQLPRLQLNASFEKMIPTGHPYIANYLAHKARLAGLGNAVRIAVENPAGTVYDTHYLRTLQQLNDEVFLLPGVYRQFMRSLWTPNTRWLAVTENGLDGGPVMPEDFDGSAAALAQLRANVDRSGEVGQLVAADHRSSIVFVPLLDRDASGRELDLPAFAARLEALRTQYEARGVKLHITGFAKVVGDLVEGLQQILLFFAVAVAIAVAIVYGYTRCLRSTGVVVACSLVAVVWQLGLLPLLGLGLDAYSILVPFLVFAIGMSHGAQKMNGILQDIGRGTHRTVAARYTFRRLFVAGLTALLCDAVGFAVLLVIAITVIRELALAASLGVAVLIFTNLILLPVLLSFIGVNDRAAQRSLQADSAPTPLWTLLDRFTGRRWATATVLGATALGLGGFVVSQRLQVGDLDPGAPELRADSRYNRDNAFLASHYGASSDVFVVMVAAPPGECGRYDTLRRIDVLEWQLAQLPGVAFTQSMASFDRRMMTAFNEGSLKWYELVPNESLLGNISARAPRGISDEDCSLFTLFAYLADHKADTLARVADTAAAFAREHSTAHVRFQLAAGNAGIEAATNIVIRQASREMLWWVYGAVTLLCFVTFRSWRAVAVAVLPLVLVSLLAEALMVALGMGVKVATLPVIALGVGIGVDYALYILSVTLAHLRAGLTLSAAYQRSLRFTGKVVMLTGVTLAIGVATWAFSPIKFQADMGILLAFMFVANMVAALVLLPALAHFLLPPRSNPAHTTP